MTADDIIARLRLEPHPEGGHFRETWRDATPDRGRGAGSSIYYLLKEGQISAWHRIDATEIWHFHAGSPLELLLHTEGEPREAKRLGPDLSRDEFPQVVIPRGVWQSARPLGEWTLVGCTVSPAFEPAGFELAPKGWEPS